MEHPAEATDPAAACLSSLGLWSPHCPPFASLFLPFSLSLCSCLSPSPSLTFPVISTLSFSALPIPLPGMCTLLSVNFSTAPSTSQRSLSKGTAWHPILSPHHAWEGPGLPAGSGLIPQRLFKAPWAYSSWKASWLQGEAKKLGLLSLKFLTGECFLGYLGCPAPVGCPEAPMLWGQTPRLPTISPRGLLRSSVLTHCGDPPSRGLPMQQRAPWGSETQISILKKGQPEGIAETCWEQRGWWLGKFASPRPPAGPSAAQVAFERSGKAQIRKGETWTPPSAQMPVNEDPGRLHNISKTHSPPFQKKKSEKMVSRIRPALALGWSQERAEGWVTLRLLLSTDPRKASEQIPAVCDSGQGGYVTFWASVSPSV